MALTPWLAQHVAVAQPPSLGLMPNRAVVTGGQFKYSIGKGKGQAKVTIKSFPQEEVRLAHFASPTSLSSSPLLLLS